MGGGQVRSEGESSAGQDGAQKEETGKQGRIRWSTQVALSTRRLTAPTPSHHHQGFDPMQDPLISSAVGLNGPHEPNANGAYGNWSPPRDIQQQNQNQSPLSNQPGAPYGNDQYGYGGSGG